MKTAKQTYLDFWDMPEEDLEEEDFQQIQLMESFAGESAIEFAKYMLPANHLKFIDDDFETFLKELEL